MSEAAFDALNAPHCCIKCRKPRALNATRFLPIHVATRGLPKMAAIVRKMATHVDRSGPGDLHQMDVISCEESTVCRAIKSHRTVNALRRNGSRSDLHRTADAPQTCFHLIAQSWPSAHLKRHQTAQTDRGRTPRSRSDQTAIAARSNRDRRVDVE